MTSGLALVTPIRPPRERRDVLEFGFGVVAYEPTQPGGLWRVRWVEGGQRRDTTAVSQDAAVDKAGVLVARLSRGRPTNLARATGADLVSHYLDPTRRPPRCGQWSVRHREAQDRWCRLYVVPEVGPIPCQALCPADFQRVIDRATTPSIADHLRSCVTALVSAGLEAGYLLSSQDVLRGVRWQPAATGVLSARPVVGQWQLASDGLPDVAENDWEAQDRYAVRPDEVPTTDAVHDLASAAADRRGVWWRELEVLLTAYSGLRWGEHVALRAQRIDPSRRRIAVDVQVTETRSRLELALPKGRRRRVTVYPSMTPGGVDLAAMVERRVREVGPDGLLFPSPQGRWARRSNYGRNVWNPAAQAIGWPRRANGRWSWTFHSLRHLFATWSFAIGVPLEDISRFLGHSSTRVTQDVYIHVFGDAFQRFETVTSTAPIA